MRPSLPWRRRGGQRVGQGRVPMTANVGAAPSASHPMGTQLCVSVVGQYGGLSVGGSESLGYGWSTCVAHQSGQIWASGAQAGELLRAGPQKQMSTRALVMVLFVLCLWLGAKGGSSSHRLWAVARGAQRPQIRTQESQGGSAHSYVRTADVHPAWGGSPRCTLPSVHRSRSCRPGQGPPGGRGVIVNPWSSRKVGCPTGRPTRPAYLPPVCSKFTLCRTEERPVSSVSYRRHSLRCPGLPQAKQEARRTPERPPTPA